MNTTDPDYPMLLYVYGPNGFHTGPVTVKNEAELTRKMETVVARAVAEGREVIITDMLDITLWHAKNGEIVWPKEDQSGD